MSGKDGESTCPKCGGEGCYHCGRDGKVVRCPGCGVEGHGITKSGNEFRCEHCLVVFSSSGEVIDIQEEKKETEKERLRRERGF